MSLQTIVEAGGLSYLAHLILYGATPDQVEDAAVLAFPGEQQQSIDAAVNRAYMANQVGEYISAAHPDDTVLAAAIPGYFPGHVDFEYTMRVTLTNTATGATAYRMHTEVSGQQLSYNDLLNVVGGQLGGTGGGTELDDQTPPTGGVWVVDDIEVYSLTRA